MLAMREMTQKELAERTGIRPPTISAICLGTIKHIPVDVLDRMCDVLNCQPGDLVEFIPNPTEKQKIRAAANQACRPIFSEIPFLEYILKRLINSRFKALFHKLKYRKNTCSGVNPSRYIYLQCFGMLLLCQSNKLICFSLLSLFFPILSCVIGFTEPTEIIRAVVAFISVNMVYRGFVQRLVILYKRYCN